MYLSKKEWFDRKKLVFLFAFDRKVLPTEIIMIIFSNITSNIPEIICVERRSIIYSHLEEDKENGELCICHNCGDTLDLDGYNMTHLVH